MKTRNSSQRAVQREVTATTPAVGADEQHFSMAVTPRLHAKLSASGSERWMACTPSARLEEQFPDEGSQYAAEGTFAHDLAEARLAGLLKIKKHTSSDEAGYKANPFYTQELSDYVDDYVSLALMKVQQARTKTPDAVVLLEQRLDFSPWVPEGFGTGDLVIVADNVLEVVDLKFGKGVLVSAVDNSQLRLYGLGAYNMLAHLYDVRTVRMTICQPRLDNISEEELEVEALLQWAQLEVVPAAEKAWAGEGEFVPGEHCRFCKAKHRCRARAEESLAMARFDFKQPDLLSAEEVGEVLAKAKRISDWASDLHDYAFEQATKHGRKWPGWKLVEGRSVRKYSDQDAVAAALRAANYADAVIYERSLLGITAMEKAIGKKRFGELLDGLVVKSEGKPTLVPESDKRPELSSVASAASDFQ